MAETPEKCTKQGVPAGRQRSEREVETRFEIKVPFQSSQRETKPPGGP